MTKITKVKKCKNKIPAFTIGSYNKNPHFWIFFGLIIFVLSVVIISCNDTEDEDRSIGKITIKGIPAYIQINCLPSGSSCKYVQNKLQHVPECEFKDIPDRKTFTVYFNASNFQTSADGMPECKGLVRVVDSMLQQDGTLTIVMELTEPNPRISMNPASEMPPWSGTAKYFSVYITPEDTRPYNIDAIWAKGGYTFNKSKATIDWRNLVNMRNPLLNMDIQNETLYSEIVHMDPEILSDCLDPCINPYCHCKE